MIGGATIYCVDDGEGEPVYAPTLAEARKIARGLRNPDPEWRTEVVIARYRIGLFKSSRELACALLNHSGFLAEHEEVERL